MLCYAKFYNILSEKNNGWVNTDIREIYRVSRVTVKHKEDKFLYLNDIEKTGLISFSNKNDNLNLKINFLDTNGEPVLKIEDFRELGYEYLNYIGNGKFIRCSDCKKLLRINNKNDHSTKYCKDCKHIKDLEKYAKYNHKRNFTTEPKYQNR
jgi:phage FluMu protein Com